MDLAQADAEQVARVLRSDLVAPIVGYNLGWDAIVPEVVLEVEDQAEEDRNADKLDKAVNKLGLPVPIAEAYALLRIRAPEDGEEVLSGQRQSLGLESSGISFRRAADRRLAFSGLPRDRVLGEVSVALDALAALSSSDWQEISEHMLMEDVAAIVSKHPEMSPQEAIDRLAMLYPSLDAEHMGEALTRATAAAALNGLIEVDHETGNIRPAEGGKP